MTAARGYMPSLSIGAPGMKKETTQMGSVCAVQDMLKMGNLQQRHSDRISCYFEEPSVVETSVVEPSVLDTKSKKRPRLVETSESEGDGPDDVLLDAAAALVETATSKAEVHTLRQKFKNSATRYARMVKKLKTELRESKKAHGKSDRVAIWAKEKLKESVDDFSKMYSLNEKKFKLITIANISAVEAATVTATVKEESRMEDILGLMKAEHHTKMRTIKTAVDELRYTTKFGVSEKRGVPYCPVTMEPILPMESVVSLVSDCECNSLVKASHGLVYLNKHAYYENIVCIQCRAMVHDVVVTTAKESEDAFAWRKMERLVHCITDKEVVEQHLENLETTAANKTAQDTAPLRALIGNISKLVSTGLAGR
jgi:myosin heavy subunit